MQGDLAWQALLVAAPDRGVVQVRDSLGHHRPRRRRQALQRAAAGARAGGGRARDAGALPLFDRPAAAPLLGAAPPGGAPRAMRPITGEMPAPRLRAPAGDRAPARRHALRDRLRRGAARAGALPLAGGRHRPRRPRRQPRAVDRAGAARRSRKLLPGCVFECLLPDAYYVNCRESDRRVRPFGDPRGGLLPRERAASAKPADLRAVVAGFGEERVDEYRVGFTLHGRQRRRARRRLAALRARGRERAPRPARRGAGCSSPRCGVTEVKKLDGHLLAGILRGLRRAALRQPRRRDRPRRAARRSRHPAAHFH